MKSIIIILLLCSCSPKVYKGVKNEEQLKKEVKKERQAGVITASVFAVWLYLYQQYGGE